MFRKMLFTITILTFSWMLAACDSNDQKPSEPSARSITPTQSSISKNTSPTDQPSSHSTDQSTTDNPSTSPSSSTSTSNKPKSIIPKGWELTQVGLIEGDLNQDGRSDQATIIQEKVGTERDDLQRLTKKRELIIRFAKPDGDFEKIIIAKNAVLKSSEGGVLGDPLSNLDIKNGSLFIQFDGGSRERWTQIFQFRYQDENFHLIGAKFIVNDTMDPANNTYHDYNLLTGDVIKATADADGKMTETKSNRGIKALIKLVDFDVRSIESELQ